MFVYFLYILLTLEDATLPSSNRFVSSSSFSIPEGIWISDRDRPALSGSFAVLGITGKPRLRDCSGQKAHVVIAGNRKT